MKLLCHGFAALAIMVLLIPSAALAQQDTTGAKPLERITLRDGSEIIGRVEAETATSLTIRTLSGVVSTIPKDQIRSRAPVAGYVEGGQYRRNDPNSSRLFFGPTGRPLTAGQGYFSIYEIFFPAVGIGVTDWLDLSGGISLFPGASQQIYYLSAKVIPVQVRNFDLSSGVIFMNVTGSTDDFDGAGFVDVIGTYGTQEAALTGGLGWGFSGSDFTNSPVFILGGELRLSNSIKLISENWFPPNSDVQLLMFGIRFFGDQIAGDLGLLYPAGADISGFPFLPWIGFTYNFGTQ
jgi:hypothetical protein